MATVKGALSYLLRRLGGPVGLASSISGMPAGSTPGANTSRDHPIADRNCTTATKVAGGYLKRCRSDLALLTY